MVLFCRKNGVLCVRVTRWYELHVHCQRVELFHSFVKMLKEGGACVDL